MSEDLWTRVAAYFRELQDRLCTAFEFFEPKHRFREDPWDRPGGGGGRTRVLEGGEVFEKAGINFSDVHGELQGEIARELPGASPWFRATGISLVVHPRSPMVPTVHMNLRRIERGSEGEGWFGGGTDLTPYFLFNDDAKYFHSVLKDACDHFGDDRYARYKKWCDDYFYLRHRSEARGVGGIFFDYLQDEPEETFRFVQFVGQAFETAYLGILHRRIREPYEERHRRFQEVRRGRYVEFNLLYDRGTRFGLHTDGRTESILMSLPPLVRWEYDVKYPPDGFEERLISVLREPRDWAVRTRDRLAGESHV